MIIPYSTDAPIYHWPIATVAMMVLCTYAYFGCVASAVSEEDQAVVAYVDPYVQVVDPYILHYGRLQPTEWITSNFMHADFFHLLGNMIGLWGLGLIVEGKVGWWRFVLIFLGIGVGQCAMEQTVTLGMDGGSLGASSIVYGLMAICLVWAPKNDLHCIFWYGRGAGMFDISVLLYCAILLGIEILLVVVGGFATITSALLHLMGALLGAAIGVGMLKLNWVDCEQWDLLTILAGRQGERRQRAADNNEEEATPEMLARRRELALSQIRHLIAEGQPQLAYAAHKRMARQLPDWQFAAADFQQLMGAYLKQHLWDDAIKLMAEYLRRYDEKEARVRLQLARVLIEHGQRPAQALRVMEKVRESELDSRLRQVRDQLSTQAKKMQEEGEIELQTEDW